jgi:hypothetical protein
VLNDYAVLLEIQDESPSRGVETQGRQGESRRITETAIATERITLMAVRLNHTIVAAHDKEKAARFLTEILGPSFLEEPMIRKLTSGQYRLYARKKDPQTGKRKNLGTFATRQEAEKHERAVQYFKAQQ